MKDTETFITQTIKPGEMLIIHFNKWFIFGPFHFETWIAQNIAWVCMNVKGNLGNKTMLKSKLMGTHLSTQ